jgi:hypothetical protein
MKYKKIIFLINIFTSFSFFQLNTNDILNIAQEIDALYISYANNKKLPTEFISDLARVMQKKPNLKNAEKEIDQEYNNCLKKYEKDYTSAATCTKKAKSYLESLSSIHTASLTLLINKVPKERADQLGRQMLERAERTDRILNTDDSVIEYPTIKNMIREIINENTSIEKYLQ